MAKSFIKDFYRDLISEEHRNYKMHLGYTIASSLFGFICGVIVSSIIWYIATDYAISTVESVMGVVR